jgi:catalase (peroxidase I)
MLQTIVPASSTAFLAAATAAERLSLAFCFPQECGRFIMRCFLHCSRRSCPLEGGDSVTNLRLSRRMDLFSRRERKNAIEFFKYLFEYEFILSRGPGPGDVWRLTGGSDIIMLTPDIAFLNDPLYRGLSMEYANDIKALKRYFSASWYKLVTVDMGPIARCIGEQVKNGELSQNNLAAAPTRLPNYVPARRQIESLLRNDAVLSDAWINMAYCCASTCCQSDFHGGCKGSPHPRCARIGMTRKQGHG